MMIGIGLCSLPWLYEMEAFVRKCHGHFPLKQCTLEADPHLVGINLHGLMTVKMKNAPFLFWREMTIRLCLQEREGETMVRVNKSAKTDVVLFPP